MKRDFKDEYQDYIESDMPDLWSRIEPNLKEKAPAGAGIQYETRTETETIDAETQRGQEQQPGQKAEPKRKKSKIYYFKTIIPAAACLCVLLVGIGAMSLHRGAKNAEGDATSMTTEEYMEAPAKEPVEAEEAWEEAAEEAPEEAVAEEAAEAPSADSDMENGTVGITSDREELQESTTDEVDAGATMGQGFASTNDGNEGAEIIDIEKAVLTNIAVASETMQEKGYAYVYTFRLTDDSRIFVYLTKVQCDGLEEQGVGIERQSAYALSLSALDEEENGSADWDEKEFILQKIEKLP